MDVWIMIYSLYLGAQVAGADDRYESKQRAVMEYLQFREIPSALKRKVLSFPSLALSLCPSLYLYLSLSLSLSLILRSARYLLSARCGRGGAPAGVGGDAAPHASTRPPCIYPPAGVGVALHQAPVTVLA
jgi:hypothetical protein